MNTSFHMLTGKTYRVAIAGMSIIIGGCIVGAAATVVPLFAIVLALLAMLFWVYRPAAFVGMLTAGLYKADPRLFIPQGLDLTGVFAVLCLVGVIYACARSKQSLSSVMESRGFLISVIAFLAVLAISWVRSPSPQYGFTKLTHFAGVAGIAILVPLSMSQRDIVVFYRVLFVFLVIMAIDALLRSGFAPAGYFLTAFSSNYLGLARYSGYGSLTGLFYILPRQTTTLRRMLVLALSFLPSLTLLMAGGRGPVIAYLVSLCFMLIWFLTGSGAIKHTTFKGVIAVMGLMTILVSAIAVSPGGIFDVTKSRFSFMLSPETGYSTLTRVGFWKLAWSLFMRNPLLGVGLGGFSYWATGYDTREYPHNMVLEVLSETGLVGLTTLVLIFATALRGLVRAAKHGSAESRRILFLSWSLLVYAFVNSCVSGDLNDNRMVFALLSILRQGIVDYRRCQYSLKARA